MVEPLRRRVRTRALEGLSRATARVPDALLRPALGATGSLLARTRHGALARANLRAALATELDERELERIARGVFRHAARILREWLRLARGAPPDGANRERGAWIEEAVELDPSVERLERAFARGRGALLVTAHLGNWELLCAALRRAGFRGKVVGLRRPKDSGSDWLVRMRAGYGVETIAQQSSPRRLLEVLQRGEGLGLLADLEVRRIDGAFLPFFGREALTMTAPAALARARALPLMPVRCVLPASGARAYRLSVEEPLELDPTLERREATLELTARLNGVFERWIRATPEQWPWYLDRWRTRPGEHEALPFAERRRRKREEGAGGIPLTPR